MIIFGYSHKGIVVSHVPHNAQDLVHAIGHMVVPPCVDGLYRIVCTPAERRVMEESTHYEALHRDVPTARIMDLRRDAGAFAVLGGALLCEQEAN